MYLRKRETSMVSRSWFMMTGRASGLQACLLKCDMVTGAELHPGGLAGEQAGSLALQTCVPHRYLASLLKLAAVLLATAWRDACSQYLSAVSASQSLAETCGVTAGGL